MVPENCDENAGFVEVSKVGCAWWGMKTIRTCEAEKTAHGHYPRIVRKEESPILNAKKSSPQWYDDATCSKKCDTGKLVRRCHIGSGVGDGEGGAHSNSLDGSSTEQHTGAPKLGPRPTLVEESRVLSKRLLTSFHAMGLWGGRKCTCKEDQ